MMRKYIDLLRKTIVIAVLIGIIIFSFASLDSEHVINCNHEHCAICAVINFSQKVAIFFVIAILTLKSSMFIVAVFLADLYKKLEHKITLLNTLVSKKVQFNE